MSREVVALTPSELRFIEWFENDTTLTPIETRIVRALGLRLGSWVPTAALVRAVWRDTFHRDLLEADKHSLRVHISRIRRKLELNPDQTPWHIENRVQHGLYRLVDNG